MSTDLVLLHAPSVYDYREKTILYGPVSDLVPPSPVFEMYPIGLTSIAEYLGKAGYSVRIVNLAVRMMRDRKFDAAKMIASLEAPVFGIDLHWMVHCHGAIEIARLVKQLHPWAKIVFGGFSSTYFWKELINYPEVDFIIKGDSTEAPFRQLMDCITKDEGFDSVPNLVWKDGQGQVRENPFTHVPNDLGEVMINNYQNVVRSVIRFRDLAGYLPYKNWLRYPISGVVTCRGCTENCVICGGSAAAFRRCYNREKPAFRTPQAVANNVKQIARFSRGPIFILGDLCQPGEDYAHELLRLLRKIGVKNQFIFELFVPAPTTILHEIGATCPGFCLEISPESHDLEVRRAAGRNYTNEALEQTLTDAMAAGSSRIDIFFMIGLPQQTAQSALDAALYGDYLMQKFKGDKRLQMFTAPVSPFLDPGSLGFEQPERHGYKVLFRTLEEHRQALVQPTWKYSLNYETNWMDRQQIVDTSYEAILRLNKVKAKYGVIPPKLAISGEQRIVASREMAHRMELLLAEGSLKDELPHLKPIVDRINNFPISEKRQLELPVGLIKLKFWNTIWDWLTGK